MIADHFQHESQDWTRKVNKLEIDTRAALQTLRKAA